ncbi:MAG: HTH-type transcriptional regulator GlvR [Synergistetes bacterium ADurb.Bin520]|nr:MAG: HTH-type transcriptional regulator GlvR [Synergistetes bacterium ADurb.Bin520]
MDAKQLQELMQGKIDDMPHKAHRVVAYLLSNMREASFRSIGEVADELRVSKAQLVRVARMLGFTGYAELKDALQSAILDQVNPAAMLVKSRDGEENLPHTILRMEHANLEDTWAQLDGDKSAQFCTMVQGAQTVYCVGWGISSLVAEHLFMRLRVMGVNGFLLKRGSLTLTEQVRAVRPEDLMVVCELPSYVVEVTESIRDCADRGVPVITLTDSPAAPTCRFASLHLFASAGSPTFGSSIVGPLFLVNVLTSLLALSLGDAAHQAMEAQATFLHDTRIFHPIFGLKY